MDELEKEAARLRRIIEVMTERLNRLDGAIAAHRNAAPTTAVDDAIEILERSAAALTAKAKEARRDRAR